MVPLPLVEEQQVLLVVGEADARTADQLRGHLLDALAGQPPAVRVELDALDFCDLSGLDALHDVARTAAAAGVPLTFTGMSAQLAWLHRTFPGTGPVSPRSPLQVAGTRGTGTAEPPTRRAR